MDTHRNEQQEQQTARAHRVRQVTHYQFSWTERERGQPGTFTLQLILDHGVDEYILRPDADDVEPLRELLGGAKPVVFDLERKVLMFGTAAAA